MQCNVVPLNPANRLGLNYRAEAAHLPWPSWITDGHVHLSGVEAVRRYFEVAAWFGVKNAWSQTQLEEVDALQRAFPGRIEFVAVPNYAARDQADTFTTDWLRRIEAFRARGARIAKFWAAPRGLDFHESFKLDHPTRRRAIKLAYSLGMAIMVHVGDPDTWFATKYRDAAKYGTKMEQYRPLEALLDQYPDRPLLAAHMAGHPEDLEHLQRLLDRYPNLHLDTSATKWMVRELSKNPGSLRAFLQRNPGRVIFGTDLVVNSNDDPATAHDLYASRFWALRTLLETDYHGPSPIVDPDLSMVDPSLPAQSTATLHGCAADAATLGAVYQSAAAGFLAKLK